MYTYSIQSDNSIHNVHVHVAIELFLSFSQLVNIQYFIPYN